MSNATGRPATLWRDPQHHMRSGVSTGSPATAPRYGQPPSPPPGPGVAFGSPSLTGQADRAGGGSFGAFGGSGTGGGAAF